MDCSRCQMACSNSASAFFRCVLLTMCLLPRTCTRTQASTLATCTCVCRTLNMAARADALWRPLYTKEFGQPSDATESQASRTGWMHSFANTYAMSIRSQGCVICAALSYLVHLYALIHLVQPWLSCYTVLLQVASARSGGTPHTLCRPRPPQGLAGFPSPTGRCAGDGRGRPRPPACAAAGPVSVWSAGPDRGVCDRAWSRSAWRVAARVAWLVE